MCYELLDLRSKHTDKGGVEPPPPMIKGMVQSKIKILIIYSPSC